LKYRLDQLKHPTIKARELKRLGVGVLGEMFGEVFRKYKKSALALSRIHKEGFGKVAPKAFDFVEDVFGLLNLFDCW
jgi:hypothetical protein